MRRSDAHRFATQGERAGSAFEQRSLVFRPVGGVSVLIINLDRVPHTLHLPASSERYTLQAGSTPDDR
jgi:hypothetical protein